MRRNGIETSMDPAIEIQHQMRGEALNNRRRVSELFLLQRNRAGILARLVKVIAIRDQFDTQNHPIGRRALFRAGRDRKAHASQKPCIEDHAGRPDKPHVTLRRRMGRHRIAQGNHTDQYGFARVFQRHVRL